jgi:hypothetical protein
MGATVHLQFDRHRERRSFGVRKIGSLGVWREAARQNDGGGGSRL